MMFRSAWLVVAVASLFSTVQAEEVNSFRHSLFNGSDLSGWHQHQCEAVASDGVLTIKGGDGLLWHDSRVRDFILELEWRPLKAEKYDSGIYFRCEIPPAGKPFPAKYQVNLKQGDEANLIGFPTGKSAGIVRPGEWNRMKLQVVGETAEMTINDKPAWKVDGVQIREGHIGIQVEVPLGGAYEFKNIMLTEIGYRALFNGKDLAGWEGAGADAAACWLVEDGLLVCNGKKGPWLRSDQEFDNFNLRLDYKLKAAGNSGVYVRVPKSGNHHGDDAGIEIQILDDAAEKYATLKDWQYTGSLYGIVPANPRVAHAAEKWNTLEINCHGTRYQVFHNGVKIIDANEQAAAELGKRRQAGFLGLQNHSEHVWFRNVRVGPAVE